MSVLLALLSSLLWGSSDFLGGTTAKRLRTLVVVGASQAFALVALLPLALLLGDQPSNLWAGPAAGLAGLVGLGAFYAALAQGTMGVVAPIAAGGAVVPVIVGLARGDDPALLQLAGIAIALVGVVLASGPELSGGAGKRPLLLAVLAGACFGIVIVLIAEGSKGGQGSILITLLVMRFTSVACASLAWMARRDSLGVVRRDLPALAAIGVGDVSANLTFGLASRTGLLSVVSVLASLYPVVTVLLARQIHHERLRAAQIVGVVAALGGVALIAAA